jgi:hypothetical protein
MLMVSLCIWLGSAQVCPEAGCDVRQGAEAPENEDIRKVAETPEDEVALLQQKMIVKQGKTNLSAVADLGSSTMPVEAFKTNCPKHMESFKVARMWPRKDKELPCPAKGGMSCIGSEEKPYSHQLQMDGVFKFLTDQRKMGHRYKFAGFRNFVSPDIFMCDKKGPTDSGGWNYGAWHDTYKAWISEKKSKQKPCASFDQCFIKNCYCSYSITKLQPMGDKWYTHNQPEILAWSKKKIVAMHLILPFPWFKLGWFVNKFEDKFARGEIKLWPNPTPVYSNNPNPKGAPVPHEVGDTCYLPWAESAVTVIECDTMKHKYFVTGPFTGCSAAIASLAGFDKDEGGVKGKFLAFHMNVKSLKWGMGSDGATEHGRPRRTEAMQDMLTWALNSHASATGNKWKKALFFQDAYVYDCFTFVFIFGEASSSGYMKFWIYGSSKISPKHPAWAVAKKTWNGLREAARGSHDADSSMAMVDEYEY